MQALLSQLNSVPGVVGSMVCDTEGQVYAHAFPPLFDGRMLTSAAAVLAHGVAGLETVTGKVGMVDLRYGNSRVVVRPMSGAHLLVLCTHQTNLQLLNISASVAVPKLEKMVAVQQAQGGPVELKRAAAPAPDAGEAEKVAGIDANDLTGYVDANDLNAYEKAFLKIDGWMRKHLASSDDEPKAENADAERPAQRSPTLTPSPAGKVVKMPIATTKTKKS